MKRHTLRSKINGKPLTFLVMSASEREEVKSFIMDIISRFTIINPTTDTYFTMDEVNHIHSEPHKNPAELNEWCKQYKFMNTITTKLGKSRNQGVQQSPLYYLCGMVEQLEKVDKVYRKPKDLTASHWKRLTFITKALNMSMPELEEEGDWEAPVQKNMSDEADYWKNFKSNSRRVSVAEKSKAHLDDDTLLREYRMYSVAPDMQAPYVAELERRGIEYK